MSQLQTFLKLIAGDRIQWMAILIVTCFVSVLLLRSQSAASYPTYALAILMLVTVRRWGDLLQFWHARWVVVLLAWLSISTLWSTPFDFRESVSIWTRALLVLFFVASVAECQLRGQLQRWMSHALVLVGTVAMAAALVNFWITVPADGRLNGLGQLDTHVIAALVFGVVLIFALRLLVEDARVGWRMVALLAVGLSMLCIALSDSRTAWVSVSLGAGAFLLAHRVRDVEQLLMVMASIVLLGATLLLVLVANDEIREIILPRGDSFRLTIWSHVLERVAESPLIGLGITTPDAIVSESIVHAHPHNLYLALLFQGGIIALGLYLIVLWKCLRTAMQTFEHADAKLALAVLILGSSAFLLDGHELVDKVGEAWFLVWLPVGICLGLRWSSPVRD